jgi:phosphoribosylformimino-5-aminoimidazole carboxamide ribotide isomerase
MRLVPVIDIRNGVVVRARAGQREAYHPLQSDLTTGSDPHDVIKGLLSVYPFQTFYIADLDAIEQRGDNRTLITEIAQSFPQLKFWLDPGLRRAEDVSCWLHGTNIDLVVGSESLENIDDLWRMRCDPRILLSLDFFGVDFRGSCELINQSRHWPQRIIVMTLAHIGAQKGPDFKMLADIHERAGKREVYAAGGARDLSDLLALQDLGLAGVLLASALHEKKISQIDIEQLET